jgi:hypothetical protein
MIGMTMVSETEHNPPATQSMAAQPMGAFEAEALPHMDDLFRAAVRMLQDHGKASELQSLAVSDSLQRGSP